MPQEAQRSGKFVKVHANGSFIVFTALLADRKGRSGGVISVDILQGRCRTSYTYLPDQIVSSFLRFVESLPETFLSVILNF